ncbi:(4S)-4-hydroxy-5-phosphonooxypentane-2,3-dione isomerase [Escherichia coli]|uniref:(4S)-4-hydroxy-5-phosphonooxypentane-2,3-dione isomerase n=1 Tax=Escherichia coli TaxID=562 RepID=UPI0023EC168C|nr:(4S)-4-hydroxy-5-phosphonooxypentane-2,3-dione isomerase [Escherichia coli]MDF4112360.1 (4S)-4-hydroxy-5-phosphonooxypentane-2,3-dione isomerase [Escherichia coli]
MHVTLVEINVHEDKVDEFIEVFRQNHLGSVQEEGNLRFDVLQDPEVNSRFYIYEAYKDEDAVAFHKTTPHYKTCVAKLSRQLVMTIGKNFCWNFGFIVHL